MEVKDIVALVNAGYTKSEISELLSTASLTSPEPSGPAETPADPAPVQEPVKAEAPAAPAAAPAPAVDNSEVLAALKELTKTIQKNAILRDDLKLVKPDTAEDILGNLINPTGQK